MGIGIKSLMEDLGLHVEVQVNTGSIAAQSISTRRGAGRARHVEVRELCVEEKVRRGELPIVKVKGGNNLAGGLTKHVDRNEIEKYMDECGFTFRDGRHEVCPHLGDV
jgi:hypothetical protein